MAALREPVPLCRISNDSDLISIDDSGISGHVMVTLQSKFINLYKMDDQKIVCSWSLKQTQLVTSPSCYCSSTKEFITVINNKVVHTWKKDDADFENSKKKHFKFDIHRVLAVGGWEPIVMCSNGQADFLNKLKEVYSDSEAKKNIIYCEARTIKDLLCIICVSEKEPTVLEVKTQWCKSNESTWNHQSTHINIPAEQVCVSCSCIVVFTHIKVYALCSSDSDSTLHCTCHSEGQSTSNTYQLRTVSGTDRKSAIVCIDSTHMAVAGILQNSKRGIGIYDIKFDSLQSWQPLPDTDHNYKIFCSEGYLFTSCNRNVYALPYQCQPSTLASIFQKNTVHESGINSMESSPIMHHSWNKKRNKESKNNEETIEIFNRLSNKKETNTYKQFQTSFNELITCLRQPDNEYLHDTHYMRSLVDRCLTEEKFWPKKELSMLLDSKNFPVLCVPQLFEKLSVHSETDMLDKALKTIPDVPESCLCKALQCYLGSDSRQEIMESDGLDKETSSKVCPLKQRKAALVNQVLKLPHNDVFLIECLRKLTFQNVLLLLEYLFYLLQEKSESEDSESSEKPSMLQVVDWLCAIIDAHITQLIISPDARILLINLHNAVESMVEFYDELISLDALLQQLKAKSAISQTPKVGQYCIEVLHVH